MRIFLDTETTGKEKDDRLIQVAYKYGSATVNELFKPPKKIEIEAMAVHHITEKMVSNQPTFKDSPTSKELATLLETNILIAHNASFDVEMLKREGIEANKIICTRKVASALDVSGVIPSYALQYLRYFLDLDIEGMAHDALGDVLVLEKLFDRLSLKMSEEKMLEVSSQPMLIRQFRFGKYNGKSIEEVSKTDSNYLRWLLEQKSMKPEGEEDWIFTLHYYLNRANED